MTLEEKLEEAIVKDVPYEVPGNWIWVKWGSMGEFVAGSGFKPKYQGRLGLEIPFLKVGSLKEVDGYGFVHDESNTISEEDRLELRAKLIPKNALLFAKVGEAIRLNRRALVSRSSCIDNNTMSFTCSQKINYRYIYFFSRTLDLYDISNSTTVPSIRKSDLELISIPISPLKEQQRIVDKIESLFEKLDKSKELIEEARDDFEKRRSAILNKAFRGELSNSWRKNNSQVQVSKLIEKIKSENNKYINYNFDEHFENIQLPQEWRGVKLASISKKITDGSHNPPKKQEQGYPMLSAKNISKGILDLSKVDRYVTEEDFNKENKRTNIESGDILLAIIGASIGNIAIYDIEDRVVAQRSLCIIDTFINNKFIYYMLMSDYMQREMINKATGTAQPGLYLNSIREMIIPLPSLEEQKEIVRILDKLLEDESKIDELTKLEEQIELIKKSILAKAFRGQLGTNCEEDESAIELLKEILKKE